MSFWELTGTTPPQDRKLDSYDLRAVEAAREDALTGQLRAGGCAGHAVGVPCRSRHRRAYNVAAQHPEIVERLLAMFKDHEADIEPHVDILAMRLRQSSWRTQFSN